MKRAQSILNVLFPVSVWVLIGAGFAATASHGLQGYFLPACGLVVLAYVSLMVLGLVEHRHPPATRPKPSRPKPKG